MNVYIIMLMRAKSKQKKECKIIVWKTLLANDFSIFNFNLKVLNKQFKPEILAELSTFMLASEPSESILDISIGKYNTCLTGRN